MRESSNSLNHHSIKWMFFFILLGLSVVESYAVNCGFSFMTSNFVSQINSAQQSVSHSLLVSRSSHSINCSKVRVYFGRGNANSYNRRVYNGNKSVPYNIYKESALNNVLKDINDASTNEYLSLNLSNVNTTYSEDFFFKVVDLDTVFSNGPGYYNDLIVLKLYSEKQNGTLTYERSAYMNVQIIIPRYAEISLGPVGSTHDPTSTQYIMSFGTLSVGKVAQAALNVKSTVSFGVYMSSMNGSKLKNGATAIPYEINVNNLGYRTLSNPGQSYYITQKNLSSPVNYEAFPISARIQSMPNNPDTGEYSDVITVTVTPW